MGALGHEDPFPPPELSASYVIRQETFAGTHGNGRDAPIPALHGSARLDPKQAAVRTEAGRCVARAV